MTGICSSVNVTAASRITRILRGVVASHRSILLPHDPSFLQRCVAAWYRARVCPDRSEIVAIGSSPDGTSQVTICRSPRLKYPMQIIHGDALAMLVALPDRFVHCCVISPPYFRIRDYKTEGQIGMETTIAEYIDRAGCGIRRSQTGVAG